MFTQRYKCSICNTFSEVAISFLWQPYIITPYWHHMCDGIDLTYTASLNLSVVKLEEPVFFVPVVQPVSIAQTFTCTTRFLSVTRRPNNKPNDDTDNGQWLLESKEVNLYI